MYPIKRIFTVIGAGALALAAGVLAFSGAALAWEPKKPVDFVIMAGKGGGADKMARLMQSVIEKHDIASKPFVPINKPGGSGAEALVHLKGTSGIAKDHTIMVTLNSFYTTPLRQPGLDVDISTFAPIGRMAEDTFLVWVHKDSGIDNIDAFVEAAKAAGEDWIMAGTGKGQEDQLLTDFLNRTYGLSMKYVPFKGGGRVAKELAGKHANSTVNNPSEQLGFYEAGDTVPIAAFTPERLELFPDSPTFKGARARLRLLHAAQRRRRSRYERRGGRVLPGCVFQGVRVRRVAGIHEEEEPLRRLSYRSGAQGILGPREDHPRGDAEGYRRDLRNAVAPRVEGEEILKDPRRPILRLILRPGSAGRRADQTAGCFMNDPAGPHTCSVCRAERNTSD